MGILEKSEGGDVLAFIGGLILGLFLGVVLMCLLQINGE